MRPYFETQESDETIVLVLRKHWIYLIAPFFVGAVLLGVIAFFYYSLTTGSPVELNGQPVWEALFILLVLIDFTFVITSWLVRYLNVVILTNKHLVEIEQHVLFSRRISVLSLGSIEDAASERAGLWATIFDYGNVEIQTAGEMRNFIFKFYPKPDELQKKIMTQKAQFMGRIRSAKNPVV